VRQEAGREANNYGRAMELSISLILATGCAAMRVCPTLARTFIDCVVWAYRSQDDLLEQDQFFDPYGTFDQSMNGYKDMPAVNGHRGAPAPPPPGPSLNPNGPERCGEC